MNFSLNIFARKEPSGRISLDVIEPKVYDVEDLFKNAVKKAAVYDLRDQIKYSLDCTCWGKDVVDQSKAADEAHVSGENSTEVRKAFPLALYDRGFFGVPRNNETLAKKLAQQWVEANYQD